MPVESPKVVFPEKCLDIAFHVCRNIVVKKTALLLPKFWSFLFELLP
jgi:hypothetical protein